MLKDLQTDGVVDDSGGKWEMSVKEDRPGYTEGKTDYIWKTMQKADRWAQDTGWRPGPSDA